MKKGYLPTAYPVLKNGAHLKTFSRRSALRLEKAPELGTRYPPPPTCHSVMSFQRQRGPQLKTFSLLLTVIGRRTGHTFLPFRWFCCFPPPSSPWKVCSLNCTPAKMCIFLKKILLP